MTLAFRNDPEYNKPDPDYDAVKAKFLLSRAYELVVLGYSFKDGIARAEREWNGTYN